MRHMAVPGQDEMRLFLGILGSWTAIHMNSKEVKLPDFTPFRVTTQDALACQACLSYCRLTHSPPAGVKGCTSSLETRDSAQLETATGQAARDSSSLLSFVSCWTGAPRAQEKKAQWQQLAGACVCPCTQSQQLVLFPLLSRCNRPHMGTLSRTLSCLGTAAPVMS
jgi:hypothetical protein